MRIKFFQNGMPTSLELTEHIGKKHILRNLDLSGADFNGCNLTDVVFLGTDLSETSFKGAILDGTVIADDCRFSIVKRMAHDTVSYLLSYFIQETGYFVNFGMLSGLGSSIIGHNMIRFHERRIYPEGSFVGYKKALTGKSHQVVLKQVVIKLEIPADTLSIIYDHEKCRCSKAMVLSITDKDGMAYESAFSWYDNSFIYHLGQMAVPDKYDDDMRMGCSNGINFFLHENDAWKYRFI